MAEYPEQARAVRAEQAPAFEALADAEQSARLAELGNFVAGGFKANSWRRDLQQHMAVRSRDWKVGDVQYQGIYYPATGECGIAWFRNAGSSYEQLRFSRFEDSATMQVAWQASRDIKKGYDLRIKGSEWNTDDGNLRYAAADGSFSKLSVSDDLEGILARQNVPVGLKIQAAEIGRCHTEARLAALLPEFEQSRKRSQRVLGRLARRFTQQ